MTAIQIGRICVKTLGREAGRKVAIVDLINSNYVLVTGPKELSGVRRRRVNIGHIEPTDHVISIKRDANDSDVKSAIEKADLTDFMKEKVVPK